MNASPGALVPRVACCVAMVTLLRVPS